MTRCAWLPLQHPLYVDYHDHEWGVPSWDSRGLFEMLCLEGAQAGLSWWTILQKREHYRSVFYGFDPVKVAQMTDAQLEALLEDPGIVRHRGKIFSVRQNARAWLERDQPVEWLWDFVGGEARVNAWRNLAEVPVSTAESRAMSRALKRAGFGFVGETTCYAFMQAVGMVNDHQLDCEFRGC
ncbi:MAG: DNA-3-methyladenine glycosylase I [Verrucomicrobiales bacterium]